MATEDGAGALTVRSAALCRRSGFADRGSTRSVARGFSHHPPPRQLTPLLPFSPRRGKGALSPRAKLGEVHGEETGHRRRELPRVLGDLEPRRRPWRATGTAEQPGHLPAVPRSPTCGILRGLTLRFFPLLPGPR